MAEPTKPTVLLFGFGDESSQYLTNQARALMDKHSKPRSILISDGDIMKPKYDAVTQRLIQYVRMGGTVVLGAYFSSSVRPLDFDKYIQENWSLPWRQSNYHRTTVHFNAACGADRRLPPSYSQKATHLKNVNRASAWYLPGEGSVIESTVFQSDPIVDKTESPIVLGQIGLQHGSKAKDKVHGSLDFYRDLFQRTCALDWTGVRKEASQFIETLERLCPAHLEEMRGIAQAAGVDDTDIIALSVRTEIVFGIFTDQPRLPVKVDGCTSVALRTNVGVVFLAQNWDWMVEQAPNLLVCHVSQPDTNTPSFVMVTEAGVIGKIGFNDAGVGVCLNAIRARGVDKFKLPVHLGLGAVLESESRQDAVNKLEANGVAGSAQILVADTTGATGLECTSEGITELDMDAKGRVVHSNHLLLAHPGLDELPWLCDSPARLARMHQRLDEKVSSGKDISASSLSEIFKDKEGYPCAINRSQSGGSKTGTLFNIITELSERRASVTFGRPTENGDSIQLAL
ncbi:related to Acyl-coenzyme A:6-aminopenicillanic-acid-acyltransferase 40 kDa form [Cephalotrichum gorgonifer]|uniref:Related to Acyl-coenzyme A:6-aminopenicillanic-acid-acyltransferase 40 kDa form n=1 Tax=Cephalotrichum gorgonifer TaxID=2041049 RepID=A0AAE8N7P8_9PEZI|nr:related to Acyl-coenzyme A:6-aminopenicillanic-acid-acyltransferase 40 kDa form [Cephalotrichum gorgonifer]